MTTTDRPRPRSLTAAAAVGAVFGVMTILSGGSALFGSEAAKAAFGNIVPFVLVFNFCAGFAYVAAGLGLLRGYRWSAWLAVGIAGATLLVFAALAVHIVTGGLYETRTVEAMTLRSIVWITIAMIGCRHFRCFDRS
ncbi:MAG: hypothetical protein KDJ16_00720 [Hyphomicrobiales bacterium]|nr:hypothetical protein [Hyphomicrobiales bacterium]